MKTLYYVASSLDGFIATENDELEWLFPLGNAEDAGYQEFIVDVGALVMGSATYGWLLSHSDKVMAETGSFWPYAQPTWVFSSRPLPVIDGADIRFVSGRVRDVYANIKTTSGSANLWIVGGGDLAGQFHDDGLLDELIVHVGSATLGKGKPLFPRRVLSPDLYLVSVRQLGVGMAELRYKVCKVSDEQGT